MHVKVTLVSNPIGDRNWIPGRQPWCKVHASHLQPHIIFQLHAMISTNHPSSD